jgi:hypothetical protein
MYPEHRNEIENKLKGIESDTSAGKIGKLEKLKDWLVKNKDVLSGVTAAINMVDGLTKLLCGLPKF